MAIKSTTVFSIFQRSVSVTLEIIKKCFRKCGFDVENNCEVINDQIDGEFKELFDQFSSETDIDEYIDFDTEVVTCFASN